MVPLLLELDVTEFSFEWFESWLFSESVRSFVVRLEPVSELFSSPLLLFRLLATVWFFLPLVGDDDALASLGGFFD